MSTSKLQKIVARKLFIHFPACTIKENSRPNWLLGGKGERLELDFYIEELKAAVEVQGRQHYMYVPFFHKDYNEFLAQKDRDNNKHNICHDRGITLIKIDCEFDVDEALHILKEKESFLYGIKYEPLDWNVKNWTWERRFSRVINLMERKMLKRNKQNFMKIFSYHQKILAWLDFYGVELFDLIDKKTAQKLFDLMKRAEHKRDNYNDWA